MAKESVIKLRIDPTGVKQGSDQAISSLAKVENEVGKVGKRLQDEFGDNQPMLAAIRSINGVGAAVESYLRKMDKGGNMKQKLRATTAAVQQLEQTYRELSAAEQSSAEGAALRSYIDQLIQKGGVLRDTMDDVNNAIKRQASDTAQLDAAVGAMSALNAAVSVGAGVFGLLGANEEACAKVQKDLMAVIAIGNGLQTIQNALQKESAVMMWANKTATLVMTAATKGDNIAQTAWNVTKAIGRALLGDFTGLLIVGAGALATYALTSGDASDSQEDLSKSTNDAKDALSQEISQAIKSNQQYKENIRILAEFKGSKADEKKLVDQMNNTYGETLGYYSSVSDWYGALVRNSEEYCNQMIREAEIRALANRAAQEELKMYEMTHDANGNVKTYRRTYDTGNNRHVIGYDAAGNAIWSGGDVRTDTWSGEQTVGYQNAKRRRDALQKQMNELNKQQPKYSKGAASAPSSSSSGRHGKTTHSQNTGSTSNSRPKTPVELAEKALEDAIYGSEAWSEAKDQLKAALGDSEDYYDSYTAILKKKLSSEKLSNTSTINSMNNELAWLPTELEQRQSGKNPLGGSLKSNDVLKEYTASADGMADAMKNIQEETKASYDAWMDYVRAVQDFKKESIGSIIDNLGSSISNIGTIIGGTAGKFVSWAAQSAQAVMQMISQNAQLLVSAQALAMANGAKSAFALPFPFNLAAWATTLATITGIFASLPKFATGGIVGGSSYSGDQMLIRANSGEAVLTRAQTATLYGALNSGRLGGGGQVSFKIKGQELYGVLRNYNSKMAKVR